MSFLGEIRPAFNIVRGASLVTEREMRLLIEANKTLADALSDKLRGHEVDRDKADMDKPDVIRKYDGYFKADEKDVFFRITSMGPVDHISAMCGITLEMYGKKNGRMCKVCSLQTVKDKSFVSRESALALSIYASSQIEFIADFVGRGTLIDKEVFWETGVSDK